MRGLFAARRTEALMLAHMACRADDALALQACVKDGPVFRLLLGEWRVTRQAEPRRFRIGPPKPFQLARHPRSHALHVKRRPPVRELRGMAGAAALGRERGLEW